VVVAAQQWGIDSLALPHVLQLLQEVDYVTLHQDARGKTAQIDEHIPLLHDDLYDQLGVHWTESEPSELDTAAVENLERLASAPTRLSDLGPLVGDEETMARLLEIGEAAQFLRRLPLSDGDELIWSPFCAYEQPEALTQLFSSYKEEAIREQFEAVRAYQGLPLDRRAAVLSDAVGHGILLANTIVGSGGEAAFAFVPYRASPAQRLMEKVVLEKALILLACVRYGQHFARHAIHSPSAILRKLRDGASLKATTEAGSQYRTAAQEQILVLESTGGSFYTVKLLDTPDNIAAINLAIDLIEYGEPVASREDPKQRLLFTGGQYLTPLMTMKANTPKARLSGDFIVSLTDIFRGDSGG
jgi:hypothetical protein